MRIMATRRAVERSGDDGLALLGGPDALDHALSRADYLAITLSLDAGTRGLLGPRELALMKPGAVLINVERAEVVDEEALYRALAEGRLGGAALDVWYRYPVGADPTPPGHRTARGEPPLDLVA
jgi:phosphoglycerate dehydrogenase-like enzyme